MCFYCSPPYQSHPPYIAKAADGVVCRLQAQCRFLQLKWKVYTNSSFHSACVKHLQTDSGCHCGYLRLGTNVWAWTHLTTFRLRHPPLNTGIHLVWLVCTGWMVAAIQMCLSFQPQESADSYCWNPVDAAKWLWRCKTLHKRDNVDNFCCAKSITVAAYVLPPPLSL